MPRRGASCQREGDPERDSRDGVAKVVDRVRKERNRTADQDDDHLQGGSGAQAEQGDLYGSNAFSGAHERVVHTVGSVVAVRPNEPAGKPAHGTSVFVLRFRRIVIVMLVQRHLHAV